MDDLLHTGARAGGLPEPRPPGLDAREARVLARTRALADLLDRAFRVPGTGIRFGLDSLLGLVPVAGDTATTLVGLYPVMSGMRLNVRRGVLARMMLNLGIDWLIGLIPVLDIVFDVAYKANLKNARLLAEELERRGHGDRAFAGTSGRGAGTLAPR